MTEEDLEVINTEFTEEERAVILKRVRAARLLLNFNKDRSELIKKLAENESVSDIEEMSSGFMIKPIRYVYNNVLIKIHVDNMENITINKIRDDDNGCVSYKYRANSMKEVIEVIDKVHEGIDMRII